MFNLDVNYNSLDSKRKYFKKKNSTRQNSTKIQA